MPTKAIWVEKKRFPFLKVFNCLGICGKVQIVYTVYSSQCTWQFLHLTPFGPATEPSMAPMLEEPALGTGTVQQFKAQHTGSEMIALNFAHF